MNTSLLEQLIHAHATPGDEGEVMELLLAAWQAAGLATTRLGHHAVYADTEPGSGKPVLLITAHADSTGFAVDRFLDDGSLGLTTLGHPRVEDNEIPAVLKTRAGRVAGTVRRDEKSGELDNFIFIPDVASHAPRHGDRVAFAPTFTRDENLITAPYLDNRLGCWLLAQFWSAATRRRFLFDKEKTNGVRRNFSIIETKAAPGRRTPKESWRIILAATASEEMCGHGAAVLAHAIRPDAVIILDTTYESKEQRVELGGGPVLTLSDKSVLLPLAARDRLLDAFHNAGLPLQTEVYNFSGTDAKAFPFAGLPGLVIPLLLPTRGNHSPRETADLRDVEVLLKGLRLLTEMQEFPSH